MFWLQPAFSVRDLRVGREAWRLGTELLGLRRTYTNYLVIQEDVQKLPFAFTLLAADPKEVAQTPWTLTLR